MSVGDAYAVGARYEATLGEADRRAGAHYTPPEVAELLVERALAAWHAAADTTGLPLVCDPACGGGVFLVAAAEALVRSGADPREVVDQVTGIDVDAGAVAAAVEAVRTWAAGHGVDRVTPRIVCADALLSEALDDLRPDVIVGNPPFRNQLGASTTRSATERAALTERLGDVVQPYADHAALFVARAVEAAPRGVVALVLPRSFLVARDAAPARARVVAAGALREVWFPPTPVFRAKVDVVTIVVATGAAAGSSADATRVLGGTGGEVSLGSVGASELAAGATWSALWATSQGVPPVEVGSAAGTIGDHATATAGFRDQFYGVARHTSEVPSPGGLRVATTAMVDPLACRWGEREVSLAGTRRRTPWVDPVAAEADDSRLGAWIRRTAAPKVIVATQTRVIEAVPDPAGEFVPLTPLIAVLPSPADVSVHHLAAALTSPVATAWAMRRFGGSGLSSGALKLAARDVLEVPVPSDRAAWDAAAQRVVDGASAAEVGAAMQRAWGAEDAIWSWWRSRLPLH